MPQFFFHYFDGHEWSSDDHGLALDSCEMAYIEAVKCVQEMWPGLMREKVDPMRCAFEIVDSEENVLFRLSFREVLEDCQETKSLAPPHADLMGKLRQNQARAKLASADLRGTIKETRMALDEAGVLLGQLKRLELARTPR